MGRSGVGGLPERTRTATVAHGLTDTSCAMATKRALLTGVGIVLTATDALVTVGAIQFLGAIEVNPVLSGAIESLGLHVTMLIRLSLGVLFLLVLDTLTVHPNNRTGAFALGAAVFALLVVNLSNGVQLGTYMLAAAGG